MWQNDYSLVTYIFIWVELLLQFLVSLLHLLVPRARLGRDDVGDAGAEDGDHHREQRPDPAPAWLQLAPLHQQRRQAHAEVHVAQVLQRGRHQADQGALGEDL